MTNTEKRLEDKEMFILSFMGMDIVARVPDSNRMDKNQTNKVLSYAKKTLNVLINAPFKRKTVTEISESDLLSSLKEKEAPQVEKLNKEE